jgi:hypothetical protein
VTCENSGLIDKLSKKLLEREEDLEERKDDLKTWTNSLRELFEIQDAFKTDGNFRIRGKTVLDVGTDCVKPLYIALKFKPNKIIAINEGLTYSYASDLEQNSKLFTDTTIRLYDCSLFNSETLDRIIEKERIPKKRFNFVLVSKTLHHFRTTRCVAKERDEEHECLENEKCCIYGFETEIFEELLKLGKRVIVYEWFDPNEEDNDKIRGRGGYFTSKEWKDIFKYLVLSGKYRVEFIRPKKFHLDKETLNKVDSILRKVDYVCFYVEEQDVKDTKKLIAQPKE